jgi:hypothetical protein
MSLPKGMAAVMELVEGMAEEDLVVVPVVDMEEEVVVV